MTDVARDPRSEAVTLDTPSGALAGTLLVPPDVERPPLAVIIAGSGPTDRDGNSPLLAGANNSLKLLAEGLAARGIASVRYDKRGIGASRGALTSESDLRFDTYADDAAAWIRHFRDDPRFGAIAVVGHSEGSLLGIIAAQAAPVDGVVSIAGVGRAANLILHEQLSRTMPPELLAESDAITAALLDRRTVDTFSPSLAPLYRASVQPYLISWFRRNPATEIAKLRVPVLIAQGTTDVQVATTEAELLAAAKPDARLVIIDGMNHVLKRAPLDQAEQMRAYGDPAMPIPDELLDRVAEFIRGLVRGDGS